MIRKVVVICSITILIVGLRFAFGKTDHGIESVSLMQLIVNPDKYQDKHVRVIGVSRIEFEGNAIFFTKEHYENRVSENSLWIEPDYKVLESTPQQLKEFNGKYVLVEGVFNKNNKGHFAMNSGALEDITRFELMEKSRTE